MGAVVLIVIVAIVVVLLIRRNTSPGVETISQSNSPGSEKEPRDFLAEATGWLETPRPLREMLEENKQYVLDKIVSILENGGTMERKYAAFALGQIGDSKAVVRLEMVLATESVQGVREAIGAALAALRIAPSDKGFSELHRRKIIDDAYRRG